MNIIPIPVPRPSKKAMNPDRPANALILAQISHLARIEAAPPALPERDSHPRH
jgi:hypothetical protein